MTRTPAGHVRLSCQPCFLTPSLLYLTSLTGWQLQKHFDKDCVNLQPCLCVTVCVSVKASRRVRGQWAACERDANGRPPGWHCSQSGLVCGSGGSGRCGRSGGGWWWCWGWGGPSRGGVYLIMIILYPPCKLLMCCPACSRPSGMVFYSQPHVRQLSGRAAHMWKMAIAWRSGRDVGAADVKTGWCDGGQSNRTQQGSSSLRKDFSRIFLVVASLSYTCFSL